MGDYEDDEDVAEKMGVEAGAGAAGKLKGMSVDDFLGGGFKSAAGNDEDAEDDDEDEDEEGADDLEDVEGMSDDEEDVGMHADDLEKLKEKDPEFYAYLQENDKELLEFGQESDDEDEDEEEQVAKPSKSAASSSKAAQVESGPQRVTIKMLAGWQKSMLAHRSLKALRRLLIAFRCAVKPEEEDQRPKVLLSSSKKLASLTSSFSQHSNTPPLSSSTTFPSPRTREATSRSLQTTRSGI